MSERTWSMWENGQRKPSYGVGCGACRHLLSRHTVTQCRECECRREHLRLADDFRVSAKSFAELGIHGRYRPVRS